jgi:hypothetical protein
MLTHHQIRLMKIMVQLKKRTPEEWELRIGKIEDKQLRRQIAHMVWWDFLAGRGDNLEKYMKGKRKGPMKAPEIVFNELRRLGYPYGRALTRMKGYNEYYDADKKWGEKLTYRHVPVVAKAA